MSTRASIAVSTRVIRSPQCLQKRCAICTIVLVFTADLFRARALILSLVPEVSFHITLTFSLVSLSLGSALCHSLPTCIALIMYMYM
ncbi:hypothetical protein BJV74DRAFT_870379 [Russula compacta]|nr:hypothetical protein BJV74DRAFT_870379 [Russula compacta]